MGRSRTVKEMTLSGVHDQGSIVTFACYYFRSKRHYRPQDLQAILGDIVPWRIEGEAPCDACGRKDYLAVRVWKPMLEQRDRLVIRRLERLVTVRRAIWRDEPWKYFISTLTSAVVTEGCPHGSHVRRLLPEEGHA